MNDYFKIPSGIWARARNKGLSGEDTLVLLYLMTCPQTNLLGCYKITIDSAYEGLKEFLPEISNPIHIIDYFKNLQDAYLIYYDSGCDFILVYPTINLLSEKSSQNSKYIQSIMNGIPHDNTIFEKVTSALRKRMEEIKKAQDSKPSIFFQNSLGRKTG